jgi:large repetitive protein
MIRMRTLLVPGAALALAASCSSSPSSSPPDPRPPHDQPDVDRAAVALGVAIDARDAAGAPRLIRALVPRSGGIAMTAEQSARDHLAALAPLWMTQQRPAELAAHSQQRLRNGASVVRLQQRVDGVDIHHGELRVMVRPDGALAGVAGTMRPAGGRVVFRSTATAAVDRALDALYGAARVRPATAEIGEKAGYHQVSVAAAAAFEVQRARARRELLPDGDQLVPIWNVEVFASRSGFDGVPEQAARRYLIADADGRVLRDINLTASDSYVYRVFADPAGNRNPFDGALDSYGPHPAGVPDGSQPGPATSNLVVMEAFNGPRDPWLGPSATTTSGNNVDAFADIALPVGFGPGDIRPEVRAGRTLNYRYDLDAEPLATPAQSMAAAVNVFFVTNWLHDWYYDSGFTEATGNAQVDNYGRGGVAGDPLIVHAQAGATLNFRDNANMTTPADGESPVMNMFLWTGRVETLLTTPTATPETAIFEAGPRNFDLTGEVVLVEDLEGGTHTACTGVTGAVAGKIALVEFDGSCSSDAVVNNVAAAGAIGIVAMIAFPDTGPLTLVGSAAANLPGLVIGFDAGQALEAQLPATITLHRASSLERDGDLDNAIVAHEWGHYLHHRLAPCDSSQCDAMSEGWGDFVALHMMLRATDDRDGTFGMGNYALGAGGLDALGFPDPGYFGIRRFPYSTNRARNGLSFRHISNASALPETPTNPGPVAFPNAEVHNAGEIWAAMLWEVYNVLIDEHGYLEARRRISDYVVAGLLLTPPNASYTEARDAILLAAGGLDTDDMLLMAAAFAGRGAGTCAVSPSPDAPGFSDLVESGTITARLATSTPTLTDDDVSCDHDGHLDPGETGMLRLTLANSGAIAAEDVVVTAATTSPGVTLGKPVLVGSIAALSQVDVAIPVKIAATAPTRANLDIAVRVDSDAGCHTGRLAAEIHQVIGIDEEPAVATTDDFETTIQAWTPAGEGAGELWNRTADATGNHVLFGIDAGFMSDTQVVSPVLQASATEPLVVTLQHAYALEAFLVLERFFDGGVIEVSSDGGATWRDVIDVGVDPGYTGPIFDSANPLSGRHAFSGPSPGFPDRRALTLDFGTRFAGQDVQLRFRIGTDACCTAVGWTLDDITVTGTTNAPFPGIVPEPTRCTVRAAASVAEGVVGVRTMPPASLDGVPGPTDPF